MTDQLIIDTLHQLGSSERATVLMRFFKTAPGEYGHGDRFLGVTVPDVRLTVKQFRRQVTLDDIETLTLSPFHEIRLAGLLLLIELYNQARNNRERRQTIIDYYLSIVSRGNNWDLVDVIAPKLIGQHLLDHPEQRDVLYRFAANKHSLWHRRVAIVATWTLIRAGQFDDTIAIAEILLHDTHDLIHKAVGWMLREIGKRGGIDRLTAFLDRHAATMPRTALRYSIEKLSPEKRQYYMNLQVSDQSATKLAHAAANKQKNRKKIE